MYRCSLCKGVSPPKVPKLVHRVLRENGSVRREVPVCRGCKEALDAGNPNVLAILQAQVEPRLPAATTPLPKISGKKIFGRRLISTTTTRSEKS